jgi:hypothetical protein
VGGLDGRGGADRKVSLWGGFLGLQLGLLMGTVVHGLNGLDISWIRVDHVVLGHQPKTQTQPNSKI